MPARVSRIALTWKPHRERAKRSERPPPARSDELVDRGNKSRRICRREKRGIGVAAQPDHRPRPCRAVERVASGIAPKDFAGFLRRSARERRIQPHEPVPDESLDVIGCETRTGIPLANHASIFSEAHRSEAHRPLSAAPRGMRNSADLAAGSESVVREFLRSSGAVGRGAVRPSNHPFSRARRLQPERFLKSSGALIGSGCAKF